LRGGWTFFELRSKKVWRSSWLAACGGEEIGQARDGALIGETSFIRGGNASATVTASIPCRYAYWPKADLCDLPRRNPSIDLAKKSVFGLIKALAGDISLNIRIGFILNV